MWWVIDIFVTRSGTPPDLVWCTLETWFLYVLLLFLCVGQTWSGCFLLLFLSIKWFCKTHSPSCLCFPLDTHQSKERNSLSQVLYVQIFLWLGKIVGSFHVCLFVLRRPMKVWRSMSLPMLQLPPTVSFSMSYVMSTWNSWNLVFMAKALMSRS